MNFPLRCWAITLLVFASGTVFSQHILPTIPAAKSAPSGQRSAVMTVELYKEIGPQTMDQDWQPMLTHSIIKHKSRKDEELRSLKDEKNLVKFSGEPQTGAEPPAKNLAITPVVTRDFVGNTATGSCPLDNTVAISNGGLIVSAINSNIAYYDQSGNQLYTADLWSWINDPALVNNICDPKVYYDSGADRFVLYAQTCDGISANSKVIIAFSQSNNPQNGWWVYQLIGNPLSDGSWFDYPKLTVSTHDVFVTGNLFYESAGYNESVIYQMEKADGYAGSTLTWQYWYNIDSDPFTLLPVGFGRQGTTGPGILLVSTSSGGGSNIDLYQITDKLTASNETINHWDVSTTAYSPGGDAAQQGSGRLLDTGDNRSLSGFYLDGVIHFVFHSDIGSGWNGINYNRLDINSVTNQSMTFGLQGTYDYCYPAVASFSTSSTDKSVMIGFERSGSSIYPEFRVVHVDDNGNWSGSVRVRSGSSGISACGAPERWGDYSGISRKHNASTPTVWVAGAYANSNNYWNTRIAEIQATGTVGIEDGLEQEEQLNTYPNPVIDLFHTTFMANETQAIEIRILDLQGKVVKDLYQGFATPGENTFTFNKGNLAPGTYILQILDKNLNPLKNEKLIMAN